MESRNRFLKILREYNSKRVIRLVETPGRGRKGLKIVEGLKPSQIVAATGKQLGTTG